MCYNSFDLLRKRLAVPLFNDPENCALVSIVHAAIRRAVHAFDLDVRLVSYRAPSVEMRAPVQDLYAP